jgi:putative membrane protein insertion efficiency factor
MQALILLLLRAYRVAISPLMGPRCRYYPSCSQYAQTAVERYGVVRGSWFAVRRIARCHPWHPGGVDPVPERDDGRMNSSSRLQAR